MRRLTEPGADIDDVVYEELEMVPDEVFLDRWYRILPVFAGCAEKRAASLVG